MKIEITKMVAMILNTFPPKRELTNTYIPHTTMTGKHLDFKKIYRIPFGEYAQVNGNRNITNMMEEHTQGSICLIPTGNLQGTYSFLSLHTGLKIACKKFTEVPIPSVVVRRVTTMAIVEKE